MNNHSDNQRKQGDARRGTLTGMALGMALGAAVGFIFGDISAGFIIGMGIGAAVGYWRFRDTPIGMRYPAHIVRQLIISGVLYLVTLIGALYLLEYDLNQSVQIIIVLVPIIPGIWLIVSLGRAIASLDELQRRIQLEAIAIGFGISGMLALTYGLLGMAGIPQASWIYVPVVMVLGWFLGKLWTLWRYR
jgi:hypothetical protein